MLTVPFFFLRYPNILTFHRGIIRFEKFVFGLRNITIVPVTMEVSFPWGMNHYTFGSDPVVKCVSAALFAPQGKEDRDLHHDISPTTAMNPQRQPPHLHAPSVYLDQYDCARAHETARQRAGEKVCLALSACGRDKARCWGDEDIHVEGQVPHARDDWVRCRSRSNLGGSVLGRVRVLQVDTTIDHGTCA